MRSRAILFTLLAQVSQVFFRALRGTRFCCCLARVPLGNISKFCLEEGADIVRGQRRQAIWLRSWALIKLIATKIIVSKKYIIYRYCWAVFELWELLTQVAIGLGKSIVRFVLVIVSALLSLPRIDRSPFPAWIEYYLLLDSGSKSYQGVIVLYHVHNNPVMRVACWVLQEDSRDRRIKEVRASRDFPEDIVRVCVGVEDPRDLVADFEQALHRRRRKPGLDAGRREDRRRQLHRISAEHAAPGLRRLGRG